MITPGMAQFRCIATGVPRPTIEWYYEYNPLVRNRLMNNTNNVMIVEESMGTRELLSTLTLTTTTHPDDSGNYTCRAVNIVDNYFNNALLNVLCMLYYSFYTNVSVCFHHAVNELNILDN